jgi:hypothetical protein
MKNDRVYLNYFKLLRLTNFQEGTEGSKDSSTLPLLPAAWE